MTVASRTRWSAKGMDWEGGGINVSSGNYEYSYSLYSYSYGVRGAAHIRTDLCDVIRAPGEVESPIIGAHSIRNDMIDTRPRHRRWGLFRIPFHDIGSRVDSYIYVVSIGDNRDMGNEREREHEG
jgi:hypothetical protein